MRIYKSIQQIVLHVVFLLLVQGCTFAQSGEAMVYITRTGTKYHAEDCRYLKYSRYEITLEEAKERGYTACSVCKPSSEKAPAAPVAPKAAPREDIEQTMQSPKERSVKNTSTANEEATETTSRQCSALTKAGTRCKRITQNDNGKCWQHQ